MPKVKREDSWIYLQNSQMAISLNLLRVLKRWQRFRAFKPASIVIILFSCCTMLFRFFFEIITCVFLLKQLFASGSVIIGK